MTNQPAIHPADPPALLSNTRTAKQWAVEINGSWQKSIFSILDTAEKCRAAYLELGKTNFIKMAETDLDFSVRMAKDLSAIGANPELMDRTLAKDLPAKWSILARLASLSPENIRWAKGRGLITEKTSLGGALAIKKAMRSGNGDIVVGRQPKHLPSPKEANEISRATGRPVLASDDKIYTGASDAEVAVYRERRDLVYSVIDAIKALNTVASAVTPEEWFETSETWWLQELGEIDIGHGAEWLNDLALSYEGYRDAQ